VALCSDLTCSSRTIKVLDPNGFGVTSLELDSSDKPVVAYSDGNLDLRVAQCSDTACTSFTTTTLDTINTRDASLELAVGNIPVVSYTDADDVDLELARCTDATCSTVQKNTVDSLGQVGAGSLGLDSNQFPIISYADSTNADPNLATCSDLLCTTPDIIFFDFPSQEAGIYSSLVVDNDKPIFCFYNITTADLLLYNGKNNVPVLNKNMAIQAAINVPFTIGQNFLRTVDVDNLEPAQTLTYTVTTPPTQGTLNLSTFTQDQINANSVNYTYTGVIFDTFTFTVSDGEDTLGPFVFSINPSAVSASPKRDYFKTATPTLSWNRVSYATEYEIQVDNSTTFLGTLNYTDTFPPDVLFVQLPNPLADGVYYWRVRGLKGTQPPGAWSTVLSFSIDT
jgi:hypothetical protein